METDQTRRRFIAGAVCPRCALMDKILVDLNTDKRLCVSCGFSEERPGLPEESPVVAMAPKAAELPTRVSRAAHLPQRRNMINVDAEIQGIARHSGLF